MKKQNICKTCTQLLVIYAAILFFIKQVNAIAKACMQESGGAKSIENRLDDILPKQTRIWAIYDSDDSDDSDDNQHTVIIILVFFENELEISLWCFFRSSVELQSIRYNPTIPNSHV